MTDLSDALKRPGVPDAFEEAVSLYVDAAEREDVELMAIAGYAFGHLHELAGGRPEDRDPLLALVRDAAAEAVRKSGGLSSPN